MNLTTRGMGGGGRLTSFGMGGSFTGAIGPRDPYYGKFRFVRVDDDGGPATPNFISHRVKIGGPKVCL